jgi:hypothetical protein
LYCIIDAPVKLVATIPAKFHFSMNEAAAVQNCNNKGGLKFCIHTFKTGEVLSETTNERGYLINDSFQDPSSHIVLNTEYTIYNRPICYTLIDTLEQTRGCDRKINRFFIVSIKPSLFDLT